MKTYKFYDTCSLLLKVNFLLEEKDPIIISSITLNELENIKTSHNKDIETKNAAKHILQFLKEHPEKYEIHVFDLSMLDPVIEKGLTVTDDTKILATAIDYDKNKHPDETVFVTNDLALYHIANLFFGEDSIESITEDPEDEYEGFLKVYLNDEAMADLYSTQWDKN